MNIRQATIEDVPFIQQLNLKLFEYELEEFDPTLKSSWAMDEQGKDYFSKAVNRPDVGFAYVAQDQDKLIGYLVGWFYEKKNPCRNVEYHSELANMFVEESFRSQGVGKQLVDKFLEWSKAKSATHVRVETSALNKKAIKFYKENGFREYDLILEMNL